MSDLALSTVGGDQPQSAKPSLNGFSNYRFLVLFFGVLLGGLMFTAYSLYVDIDGSGVQMATTAPYFLLFIALLIALGFEFVNGFHDTANAVATVIYTRSLPAPIAVVWSGVFNFLGVLTSTGAVAFGIVSLLPVELILQVGTGAGFSMVFALLISAILWNLGTWALGLPASSSHTLIGSIIGVGVANAMMRGLSGTSGVDWSKASEIGMSLLVSPLVGFLCAALLLVILKAIIRNPTLYAEPKGEEAPPWWIRGLLVLTCTGVSFAHGSNDGQKGMGLIMLILIGVVPMAYALNRAVPEDQIAIFQTVSDGAAAVTTHHAPVAAPTETAAKIMLMDFVSSRHVTDDTVGALGVLVGSIDTQVKSHGSIKQVPADAAGNLRNDMYLASETVRFLVADPASKLNTDEIKALKAYRASLDGATKFIPNWVKIVVAVALGLGTMVGWKRIVVTVGEKIGKSHMTYAQGASAELIAAATIAAADNFGLPVSTTHVLSSGVAGTMTANGSGLQWSTVRNLILAWVLTLPASILLSGCLYAALRLIVG